MATLSQGPQPQFRNLLADAIRDYTPTLANRLNDPTSGAGLAVDAVGGLADMLIGQPYRSMNNLLSRPYVSGDPQAAEDAFNVAGAAMVGGLAAPRPKGSVGSGFNYPLYHGTDASDIAVIKESQRGPLGPGVYATPAESVARRYGQNVHELPAVDRDIYAGSGTRTDAEFAGFKRDQERLAAAAEPDKRAAVQNILDKTWTDDGYNAYWQLRQLYGGDEGAQDLFKRAGFNGISAIVDGPEVVLFGPQSLYANGGRPGALAGLLSGYGYQQQQQQPNQLADWTSNLRPGDIL
jgi:hypothetical protein